MADDVNGTKSAFGLDFAGLIVPTFISLIINYALSLVISIMIARILGPTGKGLLTLIILYPTLLVTLGHLTIHRASTVYIAEKEYKFGDFPGTTMVFVFTVSLILLTGFITVFFNFNKYFIQGVNFYLILLALGILPCSMLVQIFASILQAKKRMTEFNLITIILPTGTFICMVVTLFIFKGGIAAAVFSYFMANILTAICAIYYVKRISTDEWKFNPILLKRLIIDGGKLHLGVIATFIFLKIDMFMLGYYHQTGSVGYYSVAVAMTDLLILVPIAIQYVFYAKVPEMIIDNKEMARKTLLIYKHALVLMISTGLLFAISGKYAIRIVYGERFLPSLIPFLILLPGVCYLWQNNLFLYYLVASKKFILVSLISIFGSLINIFLNIELIPKYDATGAAISSLITYIIVGSLIFGCFLYVSKVKLKEFSRELIITKQDIGLYRKLFGWITIQRPNG